jgi:hypothetical protein
LAKHQRTDFDLARDELMSHIHRCGVLKASEEQQTHWLDDTMQYMSERFAQLTPKELEQLHEIGRRFCQPVIFRGDAGGEAESSEDYEEGEMAGAA